MSVTQLSQPPVTEPLPAARSAPLAAPSLGRLFPLPLTTMESFMVTDATPEYPMMADHHLLFSGRIDRAAFEAGLAFAVARNPLLASIVTRGPRGLQWELTDRLPPVDWAPPGTPIDERYSAYLDLTKEIGARIWVRQGQDRSTVLLHLHHACCDGIGGFAFIEDLLTGYANACPAGQPVTPRPLEPDRLLARGQVGMQSRGLMRRFTDPWVGAREAFRFFWQVPQSLAAARTDNNSDARPSGTLPITQTLSEEATSGLRCLATATGTTVNDLLLRDLFITLRRWNARHAATSPKRNLRILMPQNLRDREDRAMPSGNAMSFSFLTRSTAMCDQPDVLLQSIHAETEAVRRGKLSLYFLGSLDMLRGVGLLPWLLKRKICFATAVLTNLGDSMRRFSTKFPRAGKGLVVGNLVYEGVDAVPPLRPLTAAAFAIRNNPRTLSLSLKTDGRLFSSGDTEQLLGEYLAQLAATTAQAPVDGRNSVCET